MDIPVVETRILCELRGKGISWVYELDCPNKKAFEALDEEERDYHTWKEYRDGDRETIALLSQSVTEAPGRLVDKEKTGTEALKRLKEEYGHTSLHEAYAAFHQLSRSTIRSEESPRDFKLRQDKYASRMISGGLDPPTDEIMAAFFHSGLGGPQWR